MGHVSNGPEEQLTLTEFTQPAILTASIALHRCWSLAGGVQPEFVWAIVWVSTPPWLLRVRCLHDAAKLVQTRGRAMQGAVPAGEGAMAAVLGLSDAVIDEVCVTHCEDDAYVGAVNYNSPGQVVIAGHAAAVSAAAAFMREAGAKRVLPLPVVAFSHTIDAARGIGNGEALQDIELSDAQIPVISNVDAQPHRKATEIRSLLVRQVSEPVMWTQCVMTLLHAGCGQFLECGPGKVLTGLVKRINRDVSCIALEDPAALTNTVKECTV